MLFIPIQFLISSKVLPTLFHTVQSNLLLLVLFKAYYTSLNELFMVLEMQKINLTLVSQLVKVFNLKIEFFLSSFPLNPLIVHPNSLVLLLLFILIGGL